MAVQLGFYLLLQVVQKKGDNILMARNCHKSVYNAVEIWDLSPTYLMPKFIHSFMGEILPSDVEDALNSNP